MEAAEEGAVDHDKFELYIVDGSAGCYDLGCGVTGEFRMIYTGWTGKKTC